MSDRRELAAALAEASALKRRAREAKHARIRHLAAEGLSFSEIAARVGCNTWTVAKALATAGQKARRYDGLPHGPPC